MAEMLAKNEILFLVASGVVFVHHYVIDTLLQFALLFLLESLHVKNEEMTIVTANVDEALMNQATE